MSYQHFPDIIMLNDPALKLNVMCKTKHRRKTKVIKKQMLLLKPTDKSDCRVVTLFEQHVIYYWIHRESEGTKSTKASSPKHSLAASVLAINMTTQSVSYRMRPNCYTHSNVVLVKGLFMGTVCVT